MSELKTPVSGSRKGTLLAFGVAFILLVLITGAAIAGYMVGRASVTPTLITETTTDTITELQEVTREVTVVVTSTPELRTPTVELIAPLDSPNAVETTAPDEPATPASEMPGEERETELPSGEMDFTIYNEAWDLIEGEFDGELPDEKKRLYAAISGSIETLDDQYTRFIRPDVAVRMREDLNGSVSGIGAFVRENDDGLIEIIRPIDGQPADLAGLLAGDVIIEVDGESVLNRDFNEVLLKVRGPEGTTVTLTIVRQGEDSPLDFNIMRAVFEVPVVESEMLGDDDNRIAYLHLTSFTRNAESAVLDALNGMLLENPQGIIFDLRDNGGGYLDQAVAVADLFLPEGVVLYERSGGGIDKTFDSDNGDLAEQIPLVMLVNAGSASASEIVAGAVQDRGRGILIGEPTFGKGSVQFVHILSDESELRVTIARWYTPNNRSISEEGISPDIEVLTPVDLGGEDDAQLQRAIEYLLNDE